MTTSLEQAYSSTCYKVSIDRLEINLHIGQPNTALDNYCKEQQITSWAIITAYNPLSQALDQQQNQLANDKLQKDLQIMKLQSFAGDGIPADNNWQTEAGFFIANISQQQAEQLAKKYQQNAIVMPDPNNIPQLLWLEQPEN